MRFAPRYVTGSIPGKSDLQIWLYDFGYCGGDHPKVAFDFQKFADDTKGIFAGKYLEYVLGPRPHSRRQAMLEQLFVFAAVRALTA
jgi:hypothetical protein